MIIIGKAIKGTIVLNEKLRKPDNIKFSQQKTLLKLVKKAKKTTFGEEFDFSKILSSSDPEKSFRENVPIYDYDSIYDQWWKYLF